MKREPFKAQRNPRWTQLRQSLDALEHRAGHPSRARRAKVASDLPALYRGVCQDLALAKQRHYGRELTERLNALALRGRQHLYTARQRPLDLAATFIASTFPRAVRAQGRLLVAASVLFYGLGAFMFVCAWTWPELLGEVVSQDQIEQMERMYDPATHGDAIDRGSGGDFAMFGHYLGHNTAIGFQTFAGGIFFGIGSLLLVGYNGLVLGAVFGHLTKIEYSQTLFPFVIGHGAFELTAIVISGLAGLKLGLAVFAPGRHTRAAKLRAVAPESAVLIGGAAIFFFVAALIEAFWSASNVPPNLKIGVGTGLWVLVAFYFAAAGTGSTHEPRSR